MFSGKKWNVGAVLIMAAVLAVVIGCSGQSAEQAGANQQGQQQTGSQDGGGGSTSQAVETVKIGVINSMSGNYSAYGEQTQPVIEYLVEQINAAGGIKSLGGAKIQLVNADDASDPTRTATEVRRMITQENVAMVIGLFLTPQMTAVSPIADEYQIPFISMYAGNSRSDYLFSLGYPYDRGYAGTQANFLKFLRDEKGWDVKDVALVHSDYEAGQQVARFLEQHFNEMGFNIVGSVPLDQSATDHTSAILRLRSLNPDAIAGLATVRDGILLQQARYGQNYHETIFLGGTGAYTDPILWTELGDEIAGETLTRNLFGMTGFSPGIQSESIQAFLAELEEADLGIPIGQNAMHGAQTVRVVQAALELAGSTEPAALHNALQNLHIEAGDPHLYFPRSGGIKFGDDNMPVDSTAVIIQWNEDGSQDVVWPEEFASADVRPLD